jgi:hypothetical protein
MDLCKDDLERILYKNLSVKECYKIYFKIYSEFKKIIQKDPFLPEMFGQVLFFLEKLS